MDKEEIKRNNSVKSVAIKYGFHPNKQGFIPCPFHREKTASLKLYEGDRGYYCFGCGASGDVFDFVMQIDGVDFKEAYQSLGGEYEDANFKTRLAIYRRQKRLEQRLQKKEQLKHKVELNTMLINIYQKYIRKSEPYSDVWCDCMNALQYQLYLFEHYEKEKRWLSEAT